MATKHEAWLALTPENALDPDWPICDPHHHLWDRPNERYLLEELLQDMGGGHRIIETVHVECRSMYRKDGPQPMRSVGETQFVAGVAQSASERNDMPNVAAGIVGFADLTLGADVAPVLEAHLAKGKERFRGIRHACAWIDDTPSYGNSLKGLLLDRKFREGFACLPDYDMSFDVWIYHTQLMELVDLAEMFPQVPIIVDHIGGPPGLGTFANKNQEVFQEWKRGMAAVSACPNVTVKLGGFGMSSYGFGRSQRTTPPTCADLVEAIAPYCHWCIDQFGADRCMFESNFPVDKVSYSYTVLWNAFKRIAKDFSAGERAALLHDTAARVYRLVPNHHS